MQRKRTSVLAGLCALLTVAVATAGGGTAHASTDRAAPVAPAAGTCWRMTKAQADAWTYSGASDACRFAHTVETVGSVRIPGYVAQFGRTSDQYADFAWAACRQAVNNYIGFYTMGNHSYRFYLPHINRGNFVGFADAHSTYFAPTAAQWKAGARWASCAAVSVHPRMGYGAVQPLRQRTGSVKSKATSLTLHGWPNPATTPVFASVDLASWSGETYPGDQVWRQKADAACSRLSSIFTRLTASEPPGETHWNGGSTDAFCLRRGY